MAGYPTQPYARLVRKTFYHVTFFIVQKKSAITKIFMQKKKNH